MIDFLHSLGIAEPFGIGFFSVLLTFFAAWTFTQLFVPRIRTFAIKVGWADQPNARRLNKVPLPNAGGLAMFAGFIIPVVIVWALRPIGIPEIQIQVLAILLGGALLVLVGFIDDQYSLPPLFRLGAQVIAAMLLILNGLKIDLHLWFHGLHGMPLNALNIVVTLIWIVGITNAMNLLDGVDGVVGGISFIAGMVMLVVAAQYSDRASAVVLLAGLAGANLGYLRYNFNPSRIIMGDTGAYLLGYTLSAVALLGTLRGAPQGSLLAPLLSFALPILDTTQVIIGRLLRGQNPMNTPDKTHLHHRLRARFGDRATAYIMWGITLVFNVLGMVAQHQRPAVIGAAVLAIVVCLALVVSRRVRALVHERPDPTEPGVQGPPA